MKALPSIAALLLAAGCASMSARDTDAKHHMDNGQSSEAAGHLDDAVAQYRLAVAADPAYPSAQFELAVSLYDLDQQQLARDAVRQFHKAVALAPRDALTHYGLAIALAEYGLRAEALDQFHQALALDPTLKTRYFNEALRERGMLHKRPSSSVGDALLRHWDAAPPGEDSLAVDHQEAARKQVEYGTMFGADGNLEKAMDEYHRAVQTDPEFADAFYVLGMADKDQGNNVEAATLLQRYIQLDGPHDGPDAKRLQKAKAALAELSGTQQGTP